VKTETLDEMIQAKFGHLERREKLRARNKARKIDPKRYHKPFKLRHPNLVKYQARMRANPTPFEQKLKGLLNLAFPDKTIKAQVILETGRKSYIVDFYLPQLGLAFEADGYHHDEALDFLRDTRIKTKTGVQVIRFPNYAIKYESPQVLEILKTIARGKLAGVQRTINEAFGWRSGQSRMSESIPRAALVLPSGSQHTQRRPSAAIGARSPIAAA
jgi:very-short-patch-repair endonuclease